MICPCLECEHKDLPKQGKKIDDTGTDLRTNHKYLKNRKLKDNPCWVCINEGKPGEYADYIESHNPMPPTQAQGNHTIGSNVLDKSLKGEL